MSTYEFLLINHKDADGKDCRCWYLHPRSILDITTWISTYLKAAFDEGDAEHQLTYMEQADTHCAHFESPIGIMMAVMKGVVFHQCTDNDLAWKIRKANLLEDTVQGLLDAYRKYPESIYLTQGPMYAVWEKLNEPGYPTVEDSKEKLLMEFPTGRIPMFHNFMVDELIQPDGTKHYQAKVLRRMDEIVRPSWATHKFEEHTREWEAIKDIYGFRRNTRKQIMEAHGVSKL